MRYQIMGWGFPVGDKLIPVGTIIDHSASDDWSRLAATAGGAPPPNSTPLDQEAYDLMVKHYSHEKIAYVGPDVVRRQR